MISYVEEVNTLQTPDMFEDTCAVGNDTSLQLRVAEAEHEVCYTSKLETARCLHLFAFEDEADLGPVLSWLRELMFCRHSRKSFRFEDRRSLYLSLQCPCSFLHVGHGERVRTRHDLKEGSDSSCHDLERNCYQDWNELPLGIFSSRA